MTSPTPMRACFAIAVITALTLTGCTGPDKPTESSSVNTRNPPTTSAPESSSAPDVVDPPTSEAEAITDANHSLLGYYNASFENGHAGGTRLDLVTPWVVGLALRNEQRIAQYLKQKRYHLEGARTGWTLIGSRSTASTSQQQDGRTTVRYGTVRLVGCAESTNHPVGAGAPAWSNQGKKLAQVWSVLYDSHRRQWLVSVPVPVSDVQGVTALCG